MTTSTEQAIKTAYRPCRECGAEYEGRIVCGSFLPPLCPECLPKPVKYETREPPVAEVESPEDAFLREFSWRGVNVNKYRDATLATFDDTHDPDALIAASEYVEAWDAESRYPIRDWLFFYGAESKGSVVGGVQELGAVGNGKTHLGIAIARRLIESGKVRMNRYRFVTVERFFLQCEATFRDRDGASEDSLLDNYAQFDLLHLDDIGVREPSPHSVRMLDELAKAREGRGTIWTSNLSPKLIAEQHPSFKRLVSRFAGECGDGRRFMVAMSGPDRRVLRSRKNSNPEGSR